MLLWLHFPDHVCEFWYSCTSRGRYVFEKYGDLCFGRIGDLLGLILDGLGLTFCWEG